MLLAIFSIAVPAYAIDFSHLNLSGLEIKGNQNASVTIVEFSDYSCPFTAKVQPTIKQLMVRYNNRVNMVHMTFFIRPDARAAHAATLCAGEQGRYWDMHDLILKSGNFSESYARSLAANLTLDMDKFNACMAAGKDDILAAQQTMAASLNIRATPTFVIGIRDGDSINGTVIVGLHEFDVFSSAVDEQLAKPATKRAPPTLPVISPASPAISPASSASSSSSAQAQSSLALLKNKLVADFLRMTLIGRQ